MNASLSSLSNAGHPVRTCALMGFHVIVLSAGRFAA
jgi:hypothetical protein